jgi:glutamate synthase (NADPH/NADH) small chain
VRRALLPGALPAAEQHPRLAEADRRGRLEEAYEVASATNTFPEICGRVCPQDRLCEGNCVIEPGFDSVTIGSVERYIVDYAWEQGWVKPPTPTRELAQSIGIIGAGPAGLAAAERLRLRGFQVHVYDRYDRVGGLMIYGIPNFKLEKGGRARPLEAVRGGRHPFPPGHRDRPRRHLRRAAVQARRHLHRHRRVQGARHRPARRRAGRRGPGARLPHRRNRKGLGDDVPAFDSGALNAEGRDVVVIGGGDTAMDCVRTAIRQGARSVACLYRRDKANMPARCAR